MNGCDTLKPPGTGPLRNGNHRGDPINAFMTRTHRRGRVHQAMLDAYMSFPNVAPLVRDVRAFLDLPDPGYEEESFESADHGACVRLMAMATDAIAIRCLAMLVRETARWQRVEARAAKSARARFPEDCHAP